MYYPYNFFRALRCLQSTLPSWFGMPALLTVNIFFLTSCVAQKASRTPEHHLLSDTVLRHAFTGIAVYDATQNSWLHRHNSEKYFVPASNTKIPTLYAALKYLPAQLPGILYAERSDTLFLLPTGDPTLLHPDYQQHPVYDFIRNSSKVPVLLEGNWKSKPLGFGWAWDDYESYYMTERSALPIYGNYITWVQERRPEQRNGKTDTNLLVYSIPEVNFDVNFSAETAPAFAVQRHRTENQYTILPGRERQRKIEVPFVANGIATAAALLKDTLWKELPVVPLANQTFSFQPLYSQPTDSMLQQLMYRSDNFFAEQTLLMISQQLFGYMDEQRLIDTLLQTDFKDMPQKPKWVDGSGLSRYNLFTPEDFVWLLLKMKDAFGMQRLQQLFPTGNRGTLRNYYVAENGLLFAKTGTLSSHVALSGYLYTRQNRLLVFSVLVNNHFTSATSVRRAVERYLQALRQQY